MTECQHTSCNDYGSEKVSLEDGNTYRLCEDHKHMRIDGQPAEGYTPNNPDKFKTPETT